MKLFALQLLLFLLSPAALVAQETVLRYWYVGTADDARLYRELADTFHAESGIRVQVSVIGWGHFQQKYMTALAARIPPDIGSTNNGGPYELGRLGALVDLSDKFPTDLDTLQKQIYSGLWPQTYYKGSCYGIPQIATTLFMYYRIDIFARLGLQPPTDWDELDAVMRALDYHGYQSGYDWTREDGWALGVWTRPLGIGRYQRQPLSANWQHPLFLKGVQQAVRVWNLHNMPFDKNARPIAQFALPPGPRFQAMPLLIDGAWRFTEIAAKAPEIAGKWAIAPMPTAPNGNRSLVAGGLSLVIFREGKNPDAAMRWARFLMSPSVQHRVMLDYLHRRGERGALFTSVNRLTFKKYASPLDSVTTRAILQALPAIQTTQPLPGAAQADRYLDLALDEIRDKIGDIWQHRASAQNLAIQELKQLYGSEGAANEYARMQQIADSVTAVTLAAHKPAADAALSRGAQEDATYYANLASSDDVAGTNILSFLLQTAALLMAIGVLLVVSLRPLRRAWQSYAFLSPALMLFGIFLMVPMLVALYLSFSRYDPVLPLQAADWVGLKHYANLIFSASFGNSLLRSVLFVVALVPLQLIIAIILAVGLNQQLRPDKLFKFAYFSPLVTSVVAISLIWTALFVGARHGWANAILLNLGLIRDPLSFLQDGSLFMQCVLLLTAWHGLAFVILISLAGLQSIPQVRYDAARMDGAGGWQQFRHVTLPGLRPQIVFLALVGSIGAIQVFEQIYILGGGSAETGSKFGPADRGLTIVPFIFRLGFEDFRMGEASAAAFLLFALLLIFTIVFWQWQVKRT